MGKLTKFNPHQAPAGTVLGEGDQRCILTVDRGRYAIGNGTSLSANGNYEDVLGAKRAKWQPVKDDTFRLKVLDRMVRRGAMAAGTDPEFFLQKADGELLPAFEFLPSKKDGNPNIYWDGFQAEFTTPPTHCLERQQGYIHSRIATLLAMAREHSAGANIMPVAGIQVPKARLERCPAECAVLGCAPSENVYGTKGKLDGDTSKIRWRFVGGHPHFGCAERLAKSPFAKDEIIGAVKCLDALLGVAMVSMSEGYDNPMRREFYGQAGEFRKPKHGLEYRVLSNFIFTHPVLFHLAFDIGRCCVRMGFLGMRDLIDASDVEVQKCINTCDAKLARTLLKRNEPIWKKILGAVWYGYADRTFELLQEPWWENKKRHDVEANWISGPDCWRNFVVRA